MLTSELPIYRTTQRLYRLIRERVIHFPSIDKYTIGEKMLNATMDIVGSICMANNNIKDRYDTLCYLQSNYVQLQFMLRECFCARLFNEKSYADILEVLDALGKQITGWKQATYKNNNSPR